MMTPEDVIFKLGQLEPPEIARVMKDAGVKAVKCCPSACAVTQYTYLETKASHLSTGHALLWYENPNIIRVHLPASVMQFVKNFDNGCYPEIDADSSENM